MRPFLLVSKANYLNASKISPQRHKLKRSAKQDRHEPRIPERNEKRTTNHEKRSTQRNEPRNTNPEGTNHEFRNGTKNETQTTNHETHPPTYRKKGIILNLLLITKRNNYICLS